MLPLKNVEVLSFYNQVAAYSFLTQTLLLPSFQFYQPPTYLLCEQINS